jgi:hypothetical protein
VHRWYVPFEEEILGKCPCGFRKGQSATDNLFMLRCIEKFYELKICTYYLLILSRLMTQ